MVAPVRSRAAITGICSADRPRLLCLTAPLARCPGKAAPFVLEGFQDECLIGLDDPGQVLGFVEIESRQETVPPPECGTIGEIAALRGFGNRLASDQRRRPISPAVLVVQSSQWCPGQRIECLAAVGAPIPRLATGRAPGTNLIPAAMRTSEARDPAASDLRQQTFVRRGIDGLRDHDGRGGLGSTKRRGLIECVSRTFNWIIRFGQRQGP